MTPQGGGGACVRHTPWGEDQENQNRLHGTAPPPFLSPYTQSPTAHRTLLGTPHCVRCRASCGFQFVVAYPFLCMSWQMTLMFCSISLPLMRKYIAHLACDGTRERSVRVALAQWRSG